MTLKTLAAAASAALALTLAAGAPARAATVYDLVSSFSTTSSAGVDGVWSYGWDTSPDGSGFTAFTTNSACFTGLSCWQTPGMEMYQVPMVSGNLSGGTLTYADSVVHPEGLINFHPGQTLSGPDAPIDAVIRFTAQTTSSYSFAGVVAILDNKPSGVALTLGNIPTFNLYGPAADFGAQTIGAPTPFSGTFMLGAGQSIDFRVNRLDAIWNDSTGISLNITAVPEPAVWTMMILGFGGVGVALRSRRRAALATAA